MLINRKIGEYILLRRLAIGGQSEVFLALKPGPHRFSKVVVIKALPSRYQYDQKFIDLFYKEAFVSARFSHPNVITVHDTKQVGDEHFMVMDFVAGQTIADIAQRGHQQKNTLKLNHIVHLVAQAAEGLHYVHTFHDLDDTKYSVTHCDVSPQNLMVTYHGNVKVFDFGISRVDGYEANSESLAGGKYAYMSPEQCRGETVDARSDIFSLGVILYELVTGKRLFRRATKPQVIKALTEDPIQPPSAVRDDVPLYLERCIMKALERDPNLRYQSAAQFRDDLKHFLATHSDNRERQELGAYVAALFEPERREIARVVEMAMSSEHAALPLEDMALEELQDGFSPAEEFSEEWEVPMPTPEPVANPSGMERSAPANKDETAEVIVRVPEQASQSITKDQIQSLEGEMARLRDRQTMLVGALCIAIITALSIGYLHFGAEFFADSHSDIIQIAAE